MTISVLDAPAAIIDVAMTAEEMREIREGLALNQSQLARLLGVDYRSSVRWQQGEKRIPASIARFLRLLAEAKISGTKAAKLIDRRMARLATED
jgi:DNA-binding transcriptional regulator YiaG